MTAEPVTVRFVAVIHEWFMESRGFTVVELSARDKCDAEDQASAICYRRRSQFRQCAYHLIQIGPTEILLPRKLSWVERLSGRLS